ncbi:hypothetical protein [Streptomyces longisporoflavus]|uniref:Aldehyde dehydrogenase domain-containing protein n=1 Tax=Streptomyces longisporoflavus TaxID=28044 RepID=A0ABW7QJI9_9ACTN
MENPATGEPLARVTDAGTADALKALDAAVGVQSRWAASTPAACAPTSTSTAASSWRNHT